MRQIVGVDFGGTWLRIGAVKVPDPAQSFEVENIPSPQSWNELVDVLRRHDGSEVGGFALAVSGPVDDHATLIHGPNLNWLSGRNLRRDLEAELGKTVIVSNDMEAATEGEMARGVLAQFRWAIFDTISTGWGGNLVLDGRRVDGEPGHASVSFDLPNQCGAGHVGCLESLYSGSALERQIRQHIGETEIETADAWDYLTAQIASEDAWALSLLDGWAEGVGRAWANTLNRIRPLQAIVYMGTTAENLLDIPRVQVRLRRTLHAIAMFPEHRQASFPILRATYPQRSLYGAVLVFCRQEGLESFRASS